MLEMFDPPILLNRDVLPELPISIANRREAAAIFKTLPPPAESSGVAWGPGWRRRPTWLG